MGFNLNNAPTDKPSSYAEVVLTDGIHEVNVEKVEYTTSSKGNKMLRIVFKTVKEGKFIYDQIMDDPTKQVNLFRLGKLLAALGLTIEGEVELSDMTKIIRKGMPLRIAIKNRDNGYPNIDINEYEGYYPPEVAVTAPKGPIGESNKPAPIQAEAPALDTATTEAEDEFF